MRPALLRPDRGDRQCRPVPLRYSSSPSSSSDSPQSEASVSSNPARWQFTPDRHVLLIRHYPLLAVPPNRTHLAGTSQMAVPRRRSSSPMVCAAVATQASQISTPGPLMSLATASRCRSQNEHRCASGDEGGPACFARRRSRCVARLPRTAASCTLPARHRGRRTGFTQIARQTMDKRYSIDAWGSAFSSTHRFRFVVGGSASRRPWTF